VILETIPLSSSTHVTFLEQFCSIADNSCLTNLEYLMHGSMFVGIVLFFFDRWHFLFSSRAIAIIKRIFVLGFITNLATLIGFFLFFIEGYRIPYSVGFFLTSCLLISLLLVPKNRSNNWNKKNALLIGLAQGIALSPGISRFAATFVTARWCKIKPSKAFEISFLIELPILSAAFAKGGYEIYIDGYNQLISVVPLVATMMASSLLMCMSFTLIKKTIEKNYFWLFGIYTLVLSFICWVY
jgi:undecaprenyl-diphosphatase